MKTKNKVSAIEQFQQGIIKALAQHYKQTLSDSIKRGLKARKERLSTSKVAM